MKHTQASLNYFEIENLQNKTIALKMQAIKNWLRIKYIKCTSWEYWPMWLVYIPASFYFIYYCIKARSFCFFSAANPTIENGGMMFESKWDIFKIIPKQYYPTTLLIKANENMEHIITTIYGARMKFPMVAKPDRGERGWCVEILKSVTDLENYVSKYPIDFLLQQYIDYPIELSIFYYRHPTTANGIITSVTCKEYLKITGDGNATLLDLIKANDRAFLQLKKLQQTTTIDFNKILGKGETQVLVPFGNHIRGALFLDYCHIIDDQLTAVVNNLCSQIDGFYFGRFDLKCSSIEALKEGKQFSILELNGSGAEPAHIYQPGFSYFKGQQVIVAHYKMMYDAAKANHEKGVAYMKMLRDACV